MGNIKRFIGDAFGGIDSHFVYWNTAIDLLGNIYIGHYARETI